MASGSGDKTRETVSTAALQRPTAWRKLMILWKKNRLACELLKDGRGVLPWRQRFLEPEAKTMSITWIRTVTCAIGLSLIAAWCWPAQAAGMPPDSGASAPAAPASAATH